MLYYCELYMDKSSCVCAVYPCIHWYRVQYVIRTVVQCVKRHNLHAHIRHDLLILSVTKLVGKHKVVRVRTNNIPLRNMYLPPKTLGSIVPPAPPGM